jgi:hypothetical protein
MGLLRAALCLRVIRWPAILKTEGWSGIVRSYRARFDLSNRAVASALSHLLSF